jgi:hypothetical protein
MMPERRVCQFAAAAKICGAISLPFSSSADQAQLGNGAAGSPIL